MYNIKWCKLQEINPNNRRGDDDWNDTINVLQTADSIDEIFTEDYFEIQAKISA